MKPFLITLPAVLLLPFFSLAQSNFRPGYVITSKNDTVKGYIDYREWSFNPGDINFKLSPGDKQVRHLTTQDISYFEVTGLEAYRLYQGPITMDDPNHANETRDTSVKNGIFFLKILQQGPHVTLYSYTDNVKIRFFVQDQGGKVDELIYRTYYVPDETDLGRGGKLVNENIYFRQLAALAVKYNMLDASSNNSSAIHSNQLFQLTIANKLYL